MAEESEVSNLEVHDGGTTGRTLVVFAEDASKESVARVTGVSSARMAHSADFGIQALDVDEVLRDTGAVYLDELKVAVMEGPPARASAAMLGVREEANDPSIVAMEPERWVFALEILDQMRPALAPDVAAAIENSRDYLRGYRDATTNLYAKLFEGAEPIREESLGGHALPRWSDTAALTWGLAATKADRSAFTGRGINVAVLDTGIDFQHPDFQGRPIVSASFIAGETEQDVVGHGTHCIGTALGAKSPAGTRRRYGVAGEASIHAGKVLNNSGSGADGGILAGIDWAIRNNCRIVSMSLGAPTRPGEPFSTVYETIAKRALDRGTLIIAAAGNESSRPAVIKPVSRPANCPSIMAVGAIDAFGRIAVFSCRATGLAGGEVDIAGPGVAVYSSWPMPRQYNTISGTSMATPHVAGIAALYLQKTPALTARDLWRALQQNALALTDPRIDVGAGLVQSV